MVKTSRFGYDDDLYKYSIEYYINKRYTKFCFDIAFSKNAKQDNEYEIVIFGDGRMLKTATTNRKSKPQSVEVDISGVEYLQIVGISNKNGNNIYSLMVNPYLYP